MSKNRDSVIKQSIGHPEGYSVIPNLLWSMPISNNAKLVYSYLLSCAEKFNPGYNTIRTSCGLGSDSIRSAIAELINFGMIETLSSNGSRNIYVLSDITNWLISASAEEENQSDLGMVPVGSRYGSDEPTGGIQVRYRSDLGTVPVGSRYTPNNKPSNKPNNEFFENQKPEIPTNSLRDLEIQKNPKNEETKDIPSFRNMISLLQGQTGNRIPKPDLILPFVSSCKDNGLTIDDINTRTFVSVFFDNAKALKKSVGAEKFAEWREQIENKLEQAKAAVFLVGVLDLNSEPDGPPGKIAYTRTGKTQIDSETFDNLFAGIEVEND